VSNSTPRAGIVELRYWCVRLLSSVVVSPGSGWRPARRSDRAQLREVGGAKRATCVVVIRVLGRDNSLTLVVVRLRAASWSGVELRVLSACRAAASIVLRLVVDRRPTGSVQRCRSGYRRTRRTPPSRARQPAWRSGGELGSGQRYEVRGEAELGGRERGELVDVKPAAGPGEIGERRRGEPPSWWW